MNGNPSDSCWDTAVWTKVVDQSWANIASHAASVSKNAEYRQLYSLADAILSLSKATKTLFYIFVWTVLEMLSAYKHGDVFGD